jgi:hypothetical protein
MGKSSDLSGIDSLLDEIKGILAERERAVKERESLPPDLLSREELERAKEAFTFLCKQERAYEFQKELEGTPKELPLDEALAKRQFRSEEEKNLFIKIYNLRNTPKQTCLIPFPLKQVKRICLNGKPYVTFEKDGRAYINEEIGKRE